ncbi:MAG: DUF1905 domain-containing protein [Chitinophagaceae bacterium]|nr:DUF1905 domain-containing protein [Chitinophagaceae bacterium]
MAKLLVNKKYLLKKFPGKGGWTYAEIPEIAQNKKNPFGWVRVKGSIDGIAISKYHLMPMGNGRLFLPVKASLRKQLKKGAGDYVAVILSPDNDPVLIPEELLACLLDEPAALAKFKSLKENEQENHIRNIYTVKNTATRVSRINSLIRSLLYP